MKPLREWRDSTSLLLHLWIEINLIVYLVQGDLPLLPIVSNQIYQDQQGRLVYTQRLYGMMVEYKHRGDEHIRVATHEDFLSRHTYLDHYCFTGWGEEDTE